MPTTRRCRQLCALALSRQSAFSSVDLPHPCSSTTFVLGLRRRVLKLTRHSQQLDPTSESSTRRFCARPCAVLFEATGFVSPNPCAEMRLGLRPCDIINSITF